jgi:hypothetical protein
MTNGLLYRLQLQQALVLRLHPRPVSKRALRPCRGQEAIWVGVPQVDQGWQVGIRLKREGHTITQCSRQDELVTEGSSASAFGPSVNARPRCTLKGGRVKPPRAVIFNTQLSSNGDAPGLLLK